MELITLPVEVIRLDPENPRLPEFVDRQDQSSILKHLFRTAVLDELGRSFVDNGYWDHEPLLIVEEDGGWVVLEGNRRLAALKILRQTPEAAEAGLQFDIELGPGDRESLAEIPCHVVPGRDEVRKYLGFRHIGGLKMWGPEAKARYVIDEVDRAFAAGEQSPFLAVARRVGSNTQGIRSSYVALLLLRHAREEFGLPVDYVQYERFGVWQRTINSPDLRAYIGYGDPSTYEESHEALRGLDPDAVAEVIGDLSPQPSQGRPILADSRDATVYARVLRNEKAHGVLRQYRDLTLAQQVIEQAELPLRIGQLRNRAAILRDELERLDQVGPEVTTALNDLARVVRSMQQLAQPVAEDEGA